MSEVWIYIFLSVLGISLISLVGLVFLLFKRTFLNKFLHVLIGLAAGGMIGAALLHLIPESIELIGYSSTIVHLILGVVLFFLLERIIYLKHRHKNNGSGIKMFGPLNLLADFLHNFLDGILIASAFLIDIRTGLITAIVVLLHEIPQEIGDFGVLLKAGYRPKRALLYNFLSACSAILGAALVYFFNTSVGALEKIMVPVAAGGFLYLAIIDLFPEVFNKKENRSILASASFIIAGFSFIFLLSLFDI